MGKWVDAGINLKTPKGTLDAAAIEINRIPGFSTNKIPSSKRKDLNIFFKEGLAKQYNQDWQAGTKGITPEAEHFSRDKSRQHYFIKISSIHGYSETYNSVSVKGKVHQVVINVLHKPLVANYWHFEFSVLIDDVEIKNTGSSYKKLACNLISTRIQEVAKFKI